MALPRASTPAPAWASYFDGHLAVIPVAWKAVLRQRPLQYNFRVVLERVGHDAGVGRDDHMAVVVHLEAIFKSVALPADVLRKPVNLERLAVPGIGLDHHLVHMLVVLGALAERGVQQPAKRGGEHQTRQPGLRCLVVHR